MKGVEPSRPHGHWHLKPACLPFHHICIDGAPRGIRTLNLWILSPAPLPVGLPEQEPSRRKVSADLHHHVLNGSVHSAPPRIRTENLLLLREPPLPIGLEGHGGEEWPSDHPPHGGEEENRTLRSNLARIARQPWYMLPHAWSLRASIPPPSPCHGDALPNELRPQNESRVSLIPAKRSSTCDGGGAGVEPG